MPDLVEKINAMLDAERAYRQARQVVESLGRRMPHNNDVALAWFDDKLKADQDLIDAALRYHAALKAVFDTKGYILAMTLALPVLALSLAVLTTYRMRRMSRHPDFPVQSQAAGFMAIKGRFSLYHLIAKLFGVDVVLYDLDHLKQCNTATGNQSHTDAIFAPGMAVRGWHWRSPFRLPDHLIHCQFDNGDKFVVLCRKGTGKGMAERLWHGIRSAEVPCAVADKLEQLTGQRRFSATFVVVTSVHNINRAIISADEAAFRTKDTNGRDAVHVLTEVW